MDPHSANEAFWDASVDWWRRREDERGLWRRAADEPSLVLNPTELELLAGVDGEEVCVLGSGDNEVAFALAGLGARVTSVDISRRRLEVAAGRARELGLELTFVRADVTDLAPLADDAFAFAYTGGHMSGWVADIRKYYAEAARVLRPGGLLVVHEYHPVRRLWLDADGPEPVHDYFERGPHRYTSDEGLPTFEYHWTTADHIQAVVDAGCRIVRVEEPEGRIADEFWMAVELDKLPASLLIAGRKDPR